MEIREINFDAMESVRKKCITFAKDGNTVVKPYKTLYSLENITHDATHKDLYFEVVEDKKYHGEDSFCLFEDLQVICIKLDFIPRYWTLEKFIDALNKWKYLGVNGFYKRLEESEQNGYYINKVDIEVCALLGNIELAKHYTEYREKRIAAQETKRQTEIAERERKEKEEEEKRIAEIKKTITDAEYKIFHQEDVENLEVDGKSIINHLMKEYGIKVPLRTQGWINSKLAMIVFNCGEISYKFYGMSKRDNSTVFRKYLVELENAINEKLSLPFC